MEIRTELKSHSSVTQQRRELHATARLLSCACLIRLVLQFWAIFRIYQRLLVACISSRDSVVYMRSAACRPNSFCRPIGCIAWCMPMSLLWSVTPTMAFLD